MPRYLITGISLSLMLAFSTAACSTELLRLWRKSSKNTEQVYLALSDIPQYKVLENGRRIDIVFDTILSNTKPPEFSSDDRIVKFLAQTRNQKSVFTFFLRYAPQQAKITPLQNNTLVLEILLGNQFTKSYPELSSKLQGLEIIQQQGTGFDNPATSTPYTGNWQLFFSQYEPEITTTAPLNFTVPPFPMLSLLGYAVPGAILPPDFLKMSTEKRWDEMISIIYSAIQSHSDIEEKKLLALTLGEVLFQSGRHEEAFKQFYLLKNEYEDEPVGIASTYLIGLIRAQSGDFFIADNTFRELEAYIDPRLPLSPYIILSEIESSIATSQLDKALKLLQRDDVGYPPYLATIRELRYADYLYAAKQFIKAHVAYTLFEDKPTLYEHNSSLNGYCNTLYLNKNFEESSTCFQRLGLSINDKNRLGPISLKKAFAELHYKPDQEMYATFSTLEDTYQDSATGLRASLKKTDIHYLSRPEWRQTSTEFYRQIADTASDRDISEEASLKEAIAYSELGEHTTAIDLLMDFLRIYSKGNLVTTAQALLIELLPKSLEAYLEEGKDIEALVLAKKNRELFQNNWVDISLLGQLADAYRRLLIFDEARKLYLYLLANTDGKEKAKYYYPLISVLYNQGDYDLIENYVSEYLYNYPAGEDNDNILAVRIKALIASGNLEGAQALFPSISEDDQTLHQTAASVTFSQQNYAETVALLAPFDKKNTLGNTGFRFMLAESYYNTGQFDEAKRIFTPLAKEEKFADHARYRLAIMARKEGHDAEAIKLFQEIVETGKDPLWIQLSTRELEFAQLKDLY